VLPAGDWYDFWTGERLTGGRRLEVRPPLERVPLYVRAGALLPLATPTLHTDDPRSGELTVRAYGGTAGTFTLYEDDGRHPAALTEVALSWQSVRRTGPERAPGYRVVAWETVR
jgi:alpha-D-xyloside xylohydrolase